MNAATTANAGSKVTPEAMMEQATSKKESPFDYIIVGSGAGGGPLACRLALAKKKVLLIEAGPDPKIAGEVYDAPLFHGASTEHPDLSWQFSVRHYADNARQQADQKYDASHDDPSGSGGIFYPRSSGLGGCTSHHAMIVVRPNDSDWEQIADLTNDDSWRAKNLQPYFAKFEKCLYIDEYRGFLANLLGWLTQAWFAILRLVNPRLLLDRGGHGDQGWQPTRFIAPKLIEKILETDSQFATVLIQSAFKVIEKNDSLTALLKRYLIRLGFIRSFDPNDVSTRASSDEGGVFLIPTGIGGGDFKDELGISLKGRRAGLREFILNTQKEHPEFLVVAKGIHVTRVIFAEDATLKIPRAIGVQGIEGEYLYRASPKSKTMAGKPVEFFVRHENRDDEKGVTRILTMGEVILCCGAFNTPQLLMLSGIGDEAHINEINKNANADEKLITFRIHLPGVGRNLQDRYEVSVLSELKSPFLSLESVNFKPGDPNDRVLAQWVKDHEGLYATNGGTIAILHRSTQADPDRKEPDLFTFGAPAAFRGYYWGWSTELLKAVKGEPTERRDLWTWVILKAYTRNNGGTVQLRSAKPFDTPKICFHSFDDAAIPDWEKDVKALVEAITQMRAINGAAGSPFVREIQPAQYLAEKNEERRKLNLPEWELEDWIKNEAWGHHACGTCRMGSDPWTKDTASLTDEGAVIDSRFRVHGVAGLRVVDASVFPKIPGYFILAPIFMVSEKAAATILTDHWEENYPGEIRAIEEQAIRTRRKRARVNDKNSLIAENKASAPAAPSPVGPATNSRPPPVEHIVGLAFSGGGIRSATFSLGVLQALAAKGRLRHIDYLSSVSGGAFTASFLGRLFTRDRVAGVADPCGRAQDILTNNKSGPLSWLRDQANYLFDAGENDWLIALGVFFRNLFTIHLVIGFLLFAVFASLIGLSHLPLYQQLIPQPPSALTRFHLFLSPWWWVPVAVAGLVILPMMLGFWLAPKPHSYRSVSPYPLAAWLVLLGGCAVALARSGGAIYAAPALVVLALAWLWQESARQFVAGGDTDNLTSEGAAVRNRLTRGLGQALIIFVVSLAWVILDSLAGMTENINLLPKMITGLVVLTPLLQVLRGLAMKTLQNGASLPVSIIIKIAAVVLAFGLLFVVDFIAHCLFETAAVWEHYVFILVAFLFSAALGPAFDFLNYSSLHAYYSAHITRTFLGASNESRTTKNDVVAANVQTTLPDDDLLHFQYRPEENGGPLHLISVCINETVDQASQREIRERKGLLMTIGSFGVSVGRRYFAKWTSPPDKFPWWMNLRAWFEGTHDTTPPPPASEAIRLDADRKTREPLALQAIRLNADPNTFHPLARRDEKPAVVKTLSLGDWTGVSGAAFSTGRGRATSPLNALFMGLLNLRLGYWWHSGIQADERPGRFPVNLWTRLKRLPETLFHTQSLLLSEWRARFDGPSRELWNLTDGGEQDNSAVYELIRRRVPFIIAVDAGQDPDYIFGDIANLERLVRIDFGVEIEWQSNLAGLSLPNAVAAWINVAKVGQIHAIKGNRNRGGPGTAYAALARIKYQNCPDQQDCWLLLIKSSLIGDESLDVTQYAAEHKNFPQDSTGEQLYDDEQWESYRKLGYTAGMAVLL